MQAGDRDAHLLHLLREPPAPEAGAVATPLFSLADGYAPSDELAGDIQQFVRDRLSAYAYPRRVEFVVLIWSVPLAVMRKMSASAFASTFRNSARPGSLP